MLSHPPRRPDATGGCNRCWCKGAEAATSICANNPCGQALQCEIDAGTKVAKTSATGEHEPTERATSKTPNQHLPSNQRDVQHPIASATRIESCQLSWMALPVAAKCVVHLRAKTPPLCGTSG